MSSDTKKEFKIDYIPHLDEYILYAASFDNYVGVVNEVARIPIVLREYSATKKDISNMGDYWSEPSIWKYILQKDEQWIVNYLQNVNPNRPNYCRFKDKDLAEQVRDYFNSEIILLKLT